MPRHLLFLLLFASVLSASPGSEPVRARADSQAAGLRLAFEFDAPGFEEIDGSQIARLDGEGWLGRAGEPDLPLVVRLVPVAAEGDVRVEVLAADWIDMAAREIRPLQERTHREDELPLPWIRSDDVYGTDGWWPRNWLECSDPLLVRETRLVQLAIAPLRWNPASGALQRLVRLELRLAVDGQGGANLPLRRARDVAPATKADGARRIAEASFTRQLLGGRVLEPSTGTAPEGAPLSEIDWAAPVLPLNYLVFAREAILSSSAFANWLEWKRAKGHHVEIVSDADLGAAWTSTGIRDRIVAEYASSEHPPHFVALFGDTGGTYGLPTHSTSYDHWYATIAGNDILADVVVGRVSVENSSQLSSVLAKILQYERDPWLENDGWLKRASFLTGQGHCGLSMSQLARSVAQDLVEERGYTQIDTAFCANSPNYVFNWFNQGISFYNYRGIWGMENLSMTQLQNLSQGPRTPVAVVFTCESGEFSGQLAYTEAFLRGGSVVEPGGAVAAMGFCTIYTHTAYNNVVCGGFWSGLLDYDIPQVGTCLFRGKLDLALTLPPGDSNAANFSKWANLMGDPGMDMWCGRPGDLLCEDLPDGLFDGPQGLSLRVLDGEGTPLAGVAVCASQPGGFQIVEATDADGRAWLELPDPAGAPVSLVATRAWHRPAILELPVQAELAAPRLESIGLADDGGDGLWSPDESAELLPVFVNGSDVDPIGPFDVELELRDAASGSVETAASTLPVLAPGAAAAVETPFALTPAAGWTDGRSFDLRFRLVGDGQTHEAVHRQPLHAPRLEVLGASFVQGALDPGASGPFRVALVNRGPAASAPAPVSLGFPDGSGLALAPASLPLPGLAPGDSCLVEVEISADGGLVPGYTAPLELAWGDPVSGPRGTAATAVVLGAGLPGDPTGPDAHGYYAFESGDVQWAQAPVYNWIEIAPAAGGDGQVLPLDDHGDEQDDAVRVELPFPFVLYGEVHESMSVCSNGFVAFGETATFETDFRNHFLPTGMGPEPMLAPMWDDHMLVGDAQVCVKHVPEFGVFVVEWYRVRTNSNQRINTFQLLLHDAALYPTPSGDGEIVYQWETFVDEQANDQDFPCCTVGLKDPTATIGLTLRNYLREPATVEGIGAGRAVRLTTALTSQVEPPVLVFDDEPLAYALGEGGDTLSDSLAVGNAGAGPLVWQARVRRPPVWFPEEGARDQGGPEGAGYAWIDSDEPGGPPAGWVDVWEQSEELPFTAGSEGVAGPVALPFEMPWYGEGRGEVWISGNGFLAFAEPTSTHWQNNGGLPGGASPGLALLPWWDDLVCSGCVPGDYVRFWSNGADSVVVTWNAIPHHNQIPYGGPFTFQVVLEADGRVAYNYGEMSEADPDSDSGTIGFTGPSPQGLSIRHMQLGRSGLTIAVLPPFWLSLSTSSGLVAPGGAGQLRFELTSRPGGAVLPPGTWEAVIELSSSDPAQERIDLPVTLQVAGVSVEELQPRTFELDGPWPNPFNPTTRLRLALPAPARVRARVFNLLGQEVLSLFDGELPAGEHPLTVDGAGWASGLYLLSVEAGGRRTVRRLLLVR